VIGYGREMRRALLIVSLLTTACTDPYLIATHEKLTHTPGCGLPFGAPSDAHPSTALTLCPANALSGFVIVKGTGRHTAYGDPRDPFMPNALPDPAGCAGSARDAFSPARAFWDGVEVGLRKNLTAVISTGSHQDCTDVTPTPELLAIRLVDWADLDRTVAVVEASMRANDICSPIAIEVGGLRCVTSL